MISRGSLIAVIALLFFTSCTMIAVRPRVESIDVDIDADGGGASGNIDTGFLSQGVEVAYVENEDFELFADFNSVELDNNENGWSEKGPEIGLGVRSHFPRGEGSSLDWGVRANYLRVEEDFPGGIDDDVSFLGLTGNLGPAYSFAMSDTIFTIHGGAKGLIRRGEEKFTGLPTIDLDLYSIGVYAGFSITADEPSQVDFRAEFFAGTDKLKGFLLMAGLRF